MSRRFWTDEERNLLRTHYGRRPTRWLAEQVGRSEQAVRIRAEVLGLAKRRVVPAGLLDFIRARHAAGLLDTEICREWSALRPADRVCRKSITAYRKRLGLPHHDDRLHAVRQDCQRKQLQTLRITSIAVLAQRRVRRPAIEAGLPTDLRPLEVRVFEVLRRGGYWTRAEIAAEIGYVARGRASQRSWFKVPYGSQSALANLVIRGLVRRTLGRTRKGGGKGRTAYEYWVPIDVLQRLRPRSLIA